MFSVSMLLHFTGPMSIWPESKPHRGVFRSQGIQATTQNKDECHGTVYETSVRIISNLQSMQRNCFGS